MIVIDSNLVSEPLKLAPDPVAVDWLNRQKTENLFLASVSYAELLTGAQKLPTGRRKDTLLQKIDQIVSATFGPRILPFGHEEAIQYSLLVPRANKAGFMISIADAQIAAIAASRSFTVATRDTKPFIAAGIPVINPWQSAL